jgi:signal recognition particle GTPase
VAETLKEVRRALLDADRKLQIAKTFMRMYAKKRLAGCIECCEAGTDDG